MEARLEGEIVSAPKPKWLVRYENADVSDELQSMITSVEYTDHRTGTADELQLTLEDREGRWREGWFPSEGDRISVQFGFEGGPLLDTGEFQVDEPQLSGPPDMITIGAIAVPVTDPLRTIKSRAFDETSLKTIATTLTQELELELLGDVPEVAILRSTQNRETTLAYLARLAREYGYAFSIRPPQLVFYELAALQAAPAAFALSPRDLKHYDLKAKTQGTYAACELSWLDPETKELRRVIVYADHARQRIVLGGQQTGPTPLSASAPPSVPTRTLQHLAPMQKGEDVRSWQLFLQGQGFDPGAVDAKFGPLTKAATKGFQGAHGLVVDGKAGPDTFRVAVECGYGQPGGLQGGPTRAEVAGPILRKSERCESVQQAEIKARAYLTEANRLRAGGSLDLWPGNLLALAGANFDLLGLGRFSGKYSIDSSKHTMTRGGAYTTSIEVSFV